jgi:hypothetical protein
MSGNGSVRYAAFFSSLSLIEFGLCFAVWKSIMIVRSDHALARVCRIFYGEVVLCFVGQCLGWVGEPGQRAGPRWHEEGLN